METNKSEAKVTEQIAVSEAEDRDPNRLVVRRSGKAVA